MKVRRDKMFSLLKRSRVHSLRCRSSRMAREDKTYPQGPPPMNNTQLKSFLGMVSYYHRHIPNLSVKSSLLHGLLAMNATWNWT